MSNNTPTNHQHVTNGFDILTKVLAPYVTQELQSKYNDEWWEQGVLRSLHDHQKRALPPTGDNDQLIASLDVACCLQLMDKHWWDIFGYKFGRKNRHWIKELINTRNNKWAHKGPPDTTDEDAWRALDTMIRLAEQIDSKATERLQALACTVRYAKEDLSMMLAKQANAMLSPARMNERMERKDQIREILGYCNQVKVRVTYGAVADILGIRPQSVGEYLGNKRPDASWIVNNRTKAPTGYSKEQMHEYLFKNSRVICDAQELRQELKGRNRE